METMIFNGKRQETCDSVFAAEYFGCPHGRVAEEIEFALTLPFCRKKFEATGGTAPDGSRVYRMNRGGFMILAAALPTPQAKAYKAECDRIMAEIQRRRGGL